MGSEKYCGTCIHFSPSETPEGIKKFSKNVFKNEDGSQNLNPHLEGLQIILALSQMAGREYGRRNCSASGSAMGASQCSCPDEYQKG